MQAIIRVVATVLIIAIFAGSIIGCQFINDRCFNIRNITDYRDIPGVTAYEIESIERLKQEYDYFIYAMMLSTESFINAHGEMQGFAVHFCNWLTELFGIPFIPKLYSWDGLFYGFESGEVSFTGHLMATEYRKLYFYMTDSIALRPVKYFMIEDSPPLSEIRKYRLPRYALLEGSSTAENVLRHAITDFEAVFVQDYLYAYEPLRNGEIDAFVGIGVVEPIFEAFGDVVTKQFLPLIYSSASFATQHSHLAPIVSVVQKALENGGSEHLNELLRIGQREYCRHVFFSTLNAQECAFLRENPVIAIAAEFDNYPVSFFNSRENEWQGISFDILRQIEKITGLRFEVAHESGLHWDELLMMLESGQVSMISELARTRELENRFLWSETSFYTDRPVLISGTDMPNIDIHEVMQKRVGLTRGTIYTELFWDWFAVHESTIEFETQAESFEALIRGDIDMLMKSVGSLLHLTHYQELPNFKANIIFYGGFDYGFGFNSDEVVLRYVIDRALDFIDTRMISEQWMHRTFDYRAIMAEAQRPWIIGAALMSMSVLTLVLVLFYLKKREGKTLEALVLRRTAALEAAKNDLRVAVDEAKAANQAKSSFLSTMSHEIRTPMNAILGITEILHYKEELDPEVKSGLDKIYASGDMLLRIINDLLDLTGIEAGKFELLEDDYSVASLISDSVQLNMLRIGSKPIEFKLFVDENIPMFLYGDELRIKQILNNILSNAFKYTDEGTVTMSVTMENEVLGSELSLKFVISDTGQGMTKEQVERLFDEYARFNMSSNRKREGTGLGMSITKNLLNMMRGEINVESEYGMGTTFTVILPQFLSHYGAEPMGNEVAESLQTFRSGSVAQMEKTQISREPMPYGKVLVVDDVDMNLYVAKGLLTPYQLQIESVSSGFEAIDKISEGNVYDIIFMDHMMPDMDGVEAVKRIRDIGYKEPIVALTASAVAGQAEIFLANDFDDSIAKPIDVRRLNSILNKFIRDKQPLEVLEAAEKGSQSAAVSDAAITEVQYKRLLPENIEIPGLDIRRGLIKYDNDEGLYLKILSTYVADTRASLEVIKHISETNLSEYKIAVHAIKGTSLSVFADDIGRRAALLENAVDTRDLNYIYEHNYEFIELVWQLITDIEAMLSGIENENPKPIKQRPDEELLTKLAEACSLYSMNGVDEAMAEINKFSYTADEGLVEWLRERVSLMKFGDIIERLK